MADTLLDVSGISAGTEDKPILHDVNLKVGAGETHVLMGPNGAGKSTLGHVIMGDPTYKVTSGTITFDGQDITELSPDKRSLAGIFLSYQAPVEVPGVPLYSFLRSISQMRPEAQVHRARVPSPRGRHRRRAQPRPELPHA
jgi:Fe-S cluster assembly ATP-binding protein